MKKLTGFTFIILGFIIWSCDPTKNDTVLTPPSYQKADESSARAEIDKALDDIDQVINNNTNLNARTEAVQLPCGVIKVVPSNDSTSYSIQYGNQTPCGVKKISGEITLELIKGKKFTDSASVLKATFKDYIVEYQASGEKIKFNGVKYITNLTGSNVQNILTKKMVSHKIRAYNMQLTYTSGGKDTTRTWTIARKRTWGFENGNIDIKNVYGEIAGDTTFTIDNKTYTNVSEFGQNKEDRFFAIEVNTPFRWSNCGQDWKGPYVLKKGVAKLSSSKASKKNNINIEYSFSVKGGYKLDELAMPVYDGTCSSSGYYLEWEVPSLNLKQTSYQAY